jgi:hypothetical protein
MLNEERGELNQTYSYNDSETGAVRESYATGIAFCLDRYCFLLTAGEAKRSPPASSCQNNIIALYIRTSDRKTRY